MNDADRKILYIYEFLFNKDVLFEEMYKKSLYNLCQLRKVDSVVIFEALKARIARDVFTDIECQIFRILSLGGSDGLNFDDLR